MRYDIELHGPHGEVLSKRQRIDALSPETALLHSGIQKVLVPRPGCSYAVFAHTRARRRRLLLVTAAGGGPDGDGLAGVREPRRPLPDPGHLYAEAELPDTH